MMNSTLKVAAFLVCLAALPARALNHEEVVAPITTAKFSVACSNVEHDLSRLAPGARATDYWEGNPVNGSSHYVTELLANPGTAFTFSLRVPVRPQLYPTRWFQLMDFAGIVCYPTSRTNADPNYTLPDNGGTVPHMQRRNEVPKVISAQEYSQGFGSGFDPPVPGIAKLPLIVYSHGLGGSPLGKGYLDVMVALASQGFMVAAVFHADARISPVKIENLPDFVFTVAFFPLIVEMQAFRPLALKAMTDRLLADQGFAQGVDTDRIGAFGASLGGEAVAHLLGAKITSSIVRDCTDTEHDARIRAAVGYVPYAGWSFLPAFCEDQVGASEVTKPYLAIAGTFDTTAPLNMSKQALNQMKGSRYMVELVGGQHELRPEDAGDVLTWMVTYFNAYLDVRMDSGAMARFIRMAQVTGGRPDILTVDVHVPFANTGGETRVQEFWNKITNHYFMAAGQGEIDNILAGGAGPGWELTGQSFKAWPTMPSDTFAQAGPVCRFYGAGPNSHFFTAGADECDLLKRPGTGWFYEGVGFYIRPVGNPRVCQAGLLSVNRAYNNRAAQNDSNHRFTTSDSTAREMGTKGWAVEGTVMCARP